MVSSKLLLSLFTWFSLNTVFSYKNIVFNVLFMYKTLYKHSKLNVSNPQLNLV